MRSSHLLGNSRAGLVSSTVLLRIEFTATDASTPLRALLPHVSTLTSSKETPYPSQRRKAALLIHFVLSPLPSKQGLCRLFFRKNCTSHALPQSGEIRMFRSFSVSAKTAFCAEFGTVRKHSCGFLHWYQGRGGIFLLHFSSDRSGRALPVILALWSPDFPHDAAVGPHPATVRPGRVSIVLDLTWNVKQVAIFFFRRYNVGS